MEKIDYKHGRFNILTTSTDGFKYEEYLDFCEVNDMEPGEKDSKEFNDWCQEESKINFDTDLDNVRTCKQYNVPVVISGTLGLWDGTHEISPVTCNSVHEAIVKCINDMDDCDVWFNDGAIEVEAKHHDGTNKFMIHPVSGKRLPYLYAI